MSFVAIGMVKNAADIIETCIRANSWIIDKFVILNNMSTDRTVEILESLKQEGFDIEIIEDTEMGYSQKEKMKKLLLYVHEKYSPDYIIPLDDDEIIVPADDEFTGEDIKAFLLEQAGEDLYYIDWRVYSLAEGYNSNEPCVAKRLTQYYADSVETAKKVIIPNGVVDDEFELAQGNHFAAGPKIKNHTVIPFIKMAHYPIRSVEQIMSKALIGWMGYLALPDRKPEEGYHWELIYNYIKTGKPINIDALEILTRLYLNNPNQADCPKVEGIVNLPEEAFEIKYTSINEINYLKNYCESVEALIEKYVTLLKKE